MLRYRFVIAVWALSPIVVQGIETTDNAATPLTAPKPLVPLEQFEGPLPDDFIIATLDGNPIRLIELFEYGGFTQKLKQLRARVTANQFRAAQEAILKRNLSLYLSARVMVQEFRRQLSEEENRLVDRRLEEIWKDEVKKLQLQFEVDSVEALTAKMAEKGDHSLSGWRQNTEYRMLVGQYIRSQFGTIKDRDEAGKAIEVHQEKLMAGADLQTVVDISKK